jgi:hypothetical protein
MDEYYDNIMKGRPWDEKVGIWLRKHNADKFDEKATEAIRPIAQGIVLFNPLVGVVNDVKTLFAGEDIYGNKATRLDKGVAVASLATFGIVRSAKYISSVAKRVPEYAVKLYNKINLGTTIYSGVNATKEEFKK